MMKLLSQLIIDNYNNLVWPLARLEYENLKESIRQNGVQIPIIINENNVVLDGHH